MRDRVFLAHVGDGRAFLVRPRATLQLTEDHLVHGPISTRAKRENHPRPLSSGIGLAAPLRVDVLTVGLALGDTLLLTTDGAHAAIEDEAALGALCRHPPEVASRELVARALASGGRDNATVISVRIEDRLVKRDGPASTEADDLATVRHCPLFSEVNPAGILAVLGAAVEVEIEAGAEVHPFEAGDWCAYVLLEGLVKQGATTLGPPALLYAESLVGVDRSKPAILVSDRARCLRIRRDDFREVAAHDTALGVELFERLAAHLARTIDG